MVILDILASISYVATYGRAHYGSASLKTFSTKARRKAAAEGRTLTSLIEDGLRVIVGESRRTEKRKPVMPRVSKAGGGLTPGIDLTNPSTLQEADDLDSVRRMQRSE